MMDPVLLIGMTLLAALAFANGSNDVSKGIATLAGSGVTDYRKAILWGTAWTVIGGLLAVGFSTAMVHTFTNGVLSFSGSDAKMSSAIPMAVMAGAFGWVLFATKTGLPVSTTHAITGALCGTGLAALGREGILWGSLSHKILIPLALSPLMALGLIFVVVPLVRKTLTGWKGHCLCVIPVRQGRLQVEQNGSVRMVAAETRPLAVIDAPLCEDSRVAALRVGPDTFHWITSALTSLARGLNDAPKMAALMAGMSLASGESASAFLMPSFIAVALGMGLGSYIGGRKVTEVLAEKVTRMDHLEGLSANLTTALLVIIAARVGLPVSTTHVSSGAIIGMGLRKGWNRVNWKTVSEMALAWLLTLPISGLLAAGCYWVFRI